MLEAPGAPTPLGASGPSARRSGGTWRASGDVWRCGRSCRCASASRTCRAKTSRGSGPGPAGGPPSADAPRWPIAGSSPRPEAPGGVPLRAARLRHGSGGGPPGQPACGTTGVARGPVRVRCESGASFPVPAGAERAHAGAMGTGARVALFLAPRGARWCRLCAGGVAGGLRPRRRSCTSPAAATARSRAWTRAAAGGSARLSRSEARRARWPPGAPGPDERLLVLRTDGDGASALTLVARERDAWAERPVVVEPGAVPSLVRSDGRRLAAVAVRAAPRPAARRPSGPAGLALRPAPPRPLRPAGSPWSISVSGTVTGTHDLCASDEAVLDLAVGHTEWGPAVYAAVWTGPRLVDGRWRAGAGRIVALQAESGPPDRRVSARRGAGRGVLLAEPRGRGAVALRAGARPRRRHRRRADRARGRRRATVAAAAAGSGDARTPRRRTRCPHPPPPQARFAVAPEGGHAYVLAGHDAGSGGATLLQLDLVSGATNRIVELPGCGCGARRRGAVHLRHQSRRRRDLGDRPAGAADRPHGHARSTAPGAGGDVAVTVRVARPERARGDRRSRGAREGRARAPGADCGAAGAGLSIDKRDRRAQTAGRRGWDLVGRRRP